jgi:hypothetical protein
MGLSLFLEMEKGKRPENSRARMASHLPDHLRRIWHLTVSRLPGFTGPVPSATLDKKRYSFVPLLYPLSPALSSLDNGAGAWYDIHTNQGGPYMRAEIQDDIL